MYTAPTTRHTITSGVFFTLLQPPSFLHWGGAAEAARVHFFLKKVDDIVFFFVVTLKT